MPPGAPASRAWPCLLGLYLFAVAVNLVGLGWGLPGGDAGLLPPAPPAATAEGTDRSWAAAQDPGRNLNLVSPDPDEAETPARTLRRFYLYTTDPDEVLTMIAVARLNPLAGRWNPGITQYGGFFLYPLGAWFKLAAATGLITVRGDPSFYLAHPEALGRIYLVGRLLVVLVGALAIPLVWGIASPLYGPRVASLAAVVAAVAPAWIVWSRIMKPWAYGAPFALAALLVGRHLIGTARPARAAVWAGIFTGLAVGAGIPYAPIILGPWLGIAMRGQDRRLDRTRWAALTAAGAALTALAVQPYWFMDPGRTIAALRWLVGWGLPPDYRAGALLKFAWGTLGPAVGPPLMIAGILEGAWQIWRNRSSRPILVPVCLLFLLFAVKTGRYPEEPLFARWVLPSTLVLAGLGVGGLWRVGRALPRPVRLAPALLVIPTLLVTGAILWNFTAATGTRTTRHQAGAWVNALPEGTSIGVLAPLAPFRAPFFRLDRFRLPVAPAPSTGGADLDQEYFLVAERSDVPTSPAFLARFQEARRFTPRRLPYWRTAFRVYPFADPPITMYARRREGG